MAKYFRTYLIILASVFSLNLAQAAVSPLAVGLLPPVQFPPDDFTVTGARLSLLWGQHRQMYGLDVGVIGNRTEQRFVGLAVAGLFNYTRGQTTAVGTQLAGVTNINMGPTSVVGLQLAVGMNYNDATSTITGLQLAVANLSAFTTIYGVQAGLYNKALHVRGLQIGLVNVAETLRGVQIGLINFHRQGVFVVSPILNVGF